MLRDGVAGAKTPAPAMRERAPASGTLADASLVNVAAPQMLAIWQQSAECV